MTKEVIHINQENKIHTPKQKGEILMDLIIDGGYGSGIMTDHEIHDVLIDDEEIWQGVNRDEIKDAVKKKISKILAERKNKMEGFEKRMDELKEQKFKNKQSG